MSSCRHSLDIAPFSPNPFLPLLCQRRIVSLGTLRRRKLRSFRFRLWRKLHIASLLLLSPQSLTALRGPRYGATSRKGISYWDGHSIFNVHRLAVLWTAEAQTVASPHRPAVAGGAVPVGDCRNASQFETDCFITSPGPAGSSSSRAGSAHV